MLQQLEKIWERNETTKDEVIPFVKFIENNTSLLYLHQFVYNFPDIFCDITGSLPIAAESIGYLPSSASSFGRKKQKRTNKLQIFEESINSVEKKEALATQSEVYREFTTSNYRRTLNAAYEIKEKVFDRICKENGLKRKQVRKRYKLYVVNKQKDDNNDTNDSDLDVESLASQFSECRCQDVEIEESKLQLEEAKTE